MYVHDKKLQPRQKCGEGQVVVSVYVGWWWDGGELTGVHCTTPTLSRTGSNYPHQTIDARVGQGVPVPLHSCNSLPNSPCLYAKHTYSSLGRQGKRGCSLKSLLPCLFYQDFSLPPMFIAAHSSKEVMQYNMCMIYCTVTFLKEYKKLKYDHSI